MINQQEIFIVMTATIELNETLVQNVQRLAHKRNLTFQQVIESALQSFLTADQETGKEFHLRKNSFRGHGLQPDIKEGDWDTIREHIYGS